MTPDEARSNTEKHIARVSHFLSEMISLLAKRALCHDASKLESPEEKGFAKHTENLRGLTYGSDEYRAELAAMQEFLDHHYEHNRHHPEFHSEGVSGMTLVDLVETFCDWRAAVERHADGDIYKSIEHNAKRFKLDPQVVAILKNTAKLFDNPIGVAEEEETPG